MLALLWHVYLTSCSCCWCLISHLISTSCDFFCALSHPVAVCDSLEAWATQAYNTNGTIVEDPELGSIIQMQGDQRKNIFEALTQWNICAKDLVKVHGF